MQLIAKLKGLKKLIDDKHNYAKQNDKDIVMVHLSYSYSKLIKDLVNEKLKQLEES